MADLYRYKWKHQVRSIFNLAKPVDPANNNQRPALTDQEIIAYGDQNALVNQDIRDNVNQVANLTDALLQPKIDALRQVFPNVQANQLPAIPQALPQNQNQTLRGIVPDNFVPTQRQITEARNRVAPQQPAVNQPQQNQPQQNQPARVQRPQGIQNAQQAPQNAPPRVTNIILPQNPPDIYNFIRDANYGALTAELNDPNYNPEEETLQITINDSQLAPPPANVVFPIQNVEVTPFQYAALVGLKSIVRVLAKNPKVDVEKKINNITISDAVRDYRQVDVDKNEVVRIFQIINTAITDANNDILSEEPLDNTYGNSLAVKLDKELAKAIYTKKYNSLKTPTGIKTATVRIAEAKQKGENDAKQGLQKDPNFQPNGNKSAQEKTAYNTAYNLAQNTGVLQPSKKKGKEDGEKGSVIDPDYTLVGTKTIEEKKAYAEEYDKAKAAFQGERDGILGEPSDISRADLSEILFKVGTPAGPNNNPPAVAPDPAYVNSIKKIYEDKYNSSRVKATDTAKEAGYVGKYPSIDALTSSNVFGFGPELNKLIGFDFEKNISPVDTSGKYQEGLAEFIKKFRELSGQAKYAGYSDGVNKQAKYTTPGKIRINNKDYSIDFGKLNVNLNKQIVDNQGKISSNPAFYQAKEILAALKNIRDRNGSTLADMNTFLNTMIARPSGITGYEFTEPTVEAVRNRFGDEATQVARAVAIPPTELDLSVSSILKRITEKKFTEVKQNLNRKYFFQPETEGDITKSQFYDLVKRDLSIFPEFKQIDVIDIPPTGVSPDDTSLEYNVNIPKRLQMLYNKEFDRGVKESMRRAGGTRRKSLKSDRYTKKKRSPKK